MNQQIATRSPATATFEIAGGALIVATTTLVAAAALISDGDADAARMIVPVLPWVVAAISGTALGALVLRTLAGKPTASGVGERATA